MKSSRSDWEAAEKEKQALLRKTFLDQAVRARKKMKELEGDAMKRREERKEREREREVQHEKKLLSSRMERRKEEARKRLERRRESKSLFHEASNPRPPAHPVQASAREEGDGAVLERLRRVDDRDRTKERQRRLREEEEAHAQHSKIKKFEQEAVHRALARDRKWKAR